MTFDTTTPLDVALSPDESTLYVAESSEEPEGKRELRAYPINGDGSLGEYRVLHSFGADYRGIHRGISGMCLDTDGNIVACAGWEQSGPGPMIYVFSPTGQVLETHPVPAEPTNCAFGGPDLTDLVRNHYRRAFVPGGQYRPTGVAALSQGGVNAPEQRA